ncbi:Hypothetical protein, putative [Bodo saltans]|uniref:Uncharacterized protein n=1 Tax=Bodo saltans TaxID=75058 RepID=A0A0S4JQ40_BODSA|nr:Hypothetical protein, putative [Bodo saltans]|eukprot:CUG93642.1 Hypothetical protein, putative [Bodo saltans]
MLSEVRRLLEETDDRGISPVPFSKVADDSPPSLSSARHHQHVHQQHLHHRYTDPTTPLYGGAGRPVIGESGASPIPLSSPSRRQSSLSPNAAGYNFQQMITSHIVTRTTTSNTTGAEQRPSSRSVTAESPASQKKSAAMNSVSDLEEEIKIVEMIFTTLSSSLAYYEHGATSSLASTYSPSGEIATPSDAKNFISHFNAVITYAVAHSGLQERASTFGAHGAFSAEAALVRLVFDCPYDVIQILTNLVQSAYRSAFVPPRSGHHIPLQEEHKNLTGAQNLSGKWNHSRATTTSGGFQASSVVSVAEEFVALRLAAIDALKQLLNVAIEASTRKRPSAASVAISGAKKTTSLSVLDMLQTSFSRCGTIKVLLDVVLLPTAPEVLRVAAVETIFVFTMRCVPTSHSNDDSVRNQKNNDAPAQLKNSALQSLLTTSFDALLKAAAMDASDKVRCYTAAIIRQLISLFPRHSQVVKSVPVLLRLMAQETQLDVVALCAASIDMIVRRAALELDHAAVTGGIQNVVDTSCQLLEKSCGSFPVVLRLQPAASASSYVNDQHQYSSSILKQSATSEEDDQQFDVLESLAGLLHACVLFALSAVSADLQSVFRGMLMQGAVPRLAKICRVQHIGCARVSAACLSLMVLRAPPSFAIPLALAEPKAAVHIVHSVVSKSMPAGPISLEEDEALRQSTALFLFDIAVSVAASIVFSPLARAHWRKLLSELPTWETPFVQRLSGTLSSAELSLFTDMIIQDECGVSLNDVAAVDWDDDTHPSPHSIQCLLDAQEVRRTAKNGSSLVASLSHWRSVEQARRRPDTKRGYLCFVVFGYAFLVLGDPVPIGPTVVTLEAGAWSKQGRGESLQDLRANEREEVGDKALFTQHETVEQQQRNVTGHQNNSLYRPLFPHVGSPAPSNNEQQSRSTPQQRHAPRTTHPATMPTATATVAPPSRREAAAAAASSRAVPQQPQDDAYRHLYKEFQAALELTIFLSTHYHRNRLTPGEITGNIRGPAAPPSVVSRVVSNKTNPYANKAPIANGDRAQQMRAWTSSVVEEGDLFFFYIPLSALSVNVVEAVIGKARKHQTVAKKNFLITPQNQKERRWFLLDMHTAIMPKLIVLLQSLKKLIAVHTEESVRNALQVLPSIHMRRGNGIPPAGSAVNDTAMLEGQNNNNNKIVDKAITCSNLRSVCDFALQTFSIRMTSSAVDDIIGSFAGAGGNGSGGMMASSFFAPLFPPNAQNSAFLVEAEGGGGGSGHQHQHQQQLFQVSSRGNSSSAPSAYDDDDDIDEMALFQEAPPPQRQQHVRSDAVTSAAASGAYSIRRLSTIGGKPAAAVGGGNRPTTVVAATAYGEENDDDDDSFELMKL